MKNESDKRFVASTDSRRSRNKTEESFSHVSNHSTQGQLWWAPSRSTHLTTLAVNILHKRETWNTDGLHSITVESSACALTPVVCADMGSSSDDEARPDPATQNKLWTQVSFTHPSFLTLPSPKVAASHSATRCVRTRHRMARAEADSTWTIHIVACTICCMLSPPPP